MVLYDTNARRQAAQGCRRDADRRHAVLLDRATGKPIFRSRNGRGPAGPASEDRADPAFLQGRGSTRPKCEPKEQIPAGFKPMCEFEPINYDTPNAMYPILTTRSAPMSFNPDTKMFLMPWARPAGRSGSQRLEDPKFFIATASTAGVKTHGIIAAIDAKTNKIVWQKDMPYEIQNSGGVTTTAGGLVFHGEPDGNLQAYDAKSGDLLWQFQTGSNAAARLRPMR